MSAAYLMSVQGASAEANPFARKIYLYTSGEHLVAAKIWLAIILLAAVYLIYRRSRGMYWTLNGFLFALIFGGSMATVANLHAAWGMYHDAGETVFNYVVMVVAFMGAGSLIERFGGDMCLLYETIKDKLLSFLQVN